MEGQRLYLLEVGTVGTDGLLSMSPLTFGEKYYNLPMLPHIDGKRRDIPEQIASHVMVECCFRPGFSVEAINQLAKIQEAHDRKGLATNDLRSLQWASIDNGSALHLGQLMLEKASRLAVAASTAATLTTGTELCHKADVECLMPVVKVER